MKLVCCTFAGYHAVKNQIRMQGSWFNIEIDGQRPLRANWSLFADSFRAEAGELGISVRAFSLPSFFNYLVQLNSGEAISDVESVHADR